MGVFHAFLNCTNGTKSCNAPHISHLFTGISKLIKGCMIIFVHDCTILQLLNKHTLNELQ